MGVRLQWRLVAEEEEEEGEGGRGRRGGGGGRRRERGNYGPFDLSTCKRCMLPTAVIQVDYLNCSGPTCSVNSENQSDERIQKGL